MKDGAISQSLLCYLSVPKHSGALSPALIMRGLDIYCGEEVAEGPERGEV